MQKLLLALIFASGFLTHSVAIAQANTYPNHQIKIISPFATGGIADGFSRIIAQGLSEAYGQPVIVENKAGGGGSVGALEVMRAPKDGYTLGIATVSTTASNPAINAKIGYDPIKDFTAITNLVNLPSVLLVHPSVPVKNVKELIDLVLWSEGQVWCSPERHGAMTGIMKTQIDWIPLSIGAVRPTRGLLVFSAISDGTQS